ncbi:MAG: bifunctional [glutamine synthetase] adenylyltransferase/[glutamine synthetase]-adenylyl-L-tyrosine phosphorylase [Rhodobacteraceae bacterium]|nr:MAG: bifunctional [glutamine synthetase] adenylyltransferase/[glutamine synthetase]-adenylyl-L-tyrosine phosphorylase [Paracoccaceae bacterium]
MSLAARVAAAPRPFDAAKGREAADSLGATGLWRDLIEGTAGSSPYLARLIAQERDWLAEAEASAPEDSFAAILADVAAAESQKETAVRLRRAKRRAALLIGLADLGGVWDLQAVTGALSHFADAALAAAADAAMAAETSGPLAGLGAADAGLIVIAMGKLGARELNYSSDIDLICLFDNARWEDAYQEAKARFIQVVRRVVKLMGEMTAEGYVFRTDLRLRPNPATTPVCIATEAAEHYYESVGRTWERAAFIKARAAAGDRAAGARFLEALTPFVYRRHLDFAAIEDAHDMRLKIRAHKGQGAQFRIAGHDVKLGLGGIREIEFFAQTQQLVRGGRDASLRDPTTRGALRALEAAGVVDAASRETLDAAYVAHRTLEHRLQMIEDAQTQTIPTAETARARIAALGGWPDRDAFEREVEARCLEVRAVCDRFFRPEALGPQSDGPEDLAALGFARPEQAAALMEGWMSGRVAATRGERARRRFRALAPTLVAKLGEAASPDEAIMAFDRFLSGLPAGVQFFALCEANPQLMDLLAEICAAAPRLATYLGRHAGVLDAVLDRAFFEPLPDARALTQDLAAALAQAEDYERALDVARRWAKEKTFRAGVQVLRGVAEAHEAGRAFSAVAEACLAALYPVVVAEFARRHGAPPGGGAAVVAMGKLGSREMTATSDLDLLVICDTEAEDESAGPKPLPATVYYARLTQALIAALTAPTAEGALYAVDMRLRPSGRKGPVATRLAAFRRYQREEAWTWEHLALTRARTVAGDAAAREATEAALAEALAAPRDARKTLADVADMRARVADAHRAERDDPWALKHARGGLMDVEFAAQAGLLVTGVVGARAPRAALGLLAEAGWLPEADAEALRAAHDLMMALQHVERVALDRPFDPETAGPGLRAAMARAGGAADFDALSEKLHTAQARAAEAVDRALAPRR